MAAPEKLFRDALVADATVSGLISTRCFFLTVPQATQRPYVVLQMVSEGREAELNDVDRLPQARIQVDIIAETMPSAGQVRDAVRARMDAFSSSNLAYSRLINQFTSYDEDTEFPRVVQEYRVTYAE